MRPLLIVKTGSVLPSLVEEHGDFDELIAKGMDLPENEITVIDVRSNTVLPPPESIRGAVITGSSAMVSEPEDWAESTAAWLRHAHASGTALLGICYGHQLLAWALGGSVGRNPNGREIGTVEVRLALQADHDPLFRGLPQSLLVQETHVESVLAPPPGSRILAGNDTDPHQAIAIGDSAWGVQFHPEIDQGLIRGYISERRTILAEEGFDPTELIAAVQSSDHGTLLLARFASLLSSGH